ncbi:MAG: DUF2334 domain-containing protein [Candidatus Omnitrophica bacterium]|nr:DUF2334 domain-containing protein [Candidatus Omnitrophota bacterium]
MSARIFIRNDDACQLDKRFLYFFDLARDMGLPVIHAVIPGKIDKDCIRFLNRAKERTPRLLDIVQHGWVHADYSLDPRTKYEFGASRSYQSQQEDICFGLKKMRSAFGQNFTPAFVPPFCGYDQRTWKILVEEGFHIFSAGTRKSGKRSGMVELPAILSTTCYDNPAKVFINKATDIVQGLIRSAHRIAVAGVVTHHADFTTAASRKDLARLFKFIVALRERKKWQVYLFSDLLSKAKIKS